MAVELILDKTKPNLGIAVHTIEDNTWRSPTMYHPDEMQESDRVWSGPDFFESEFGKPLDFSNRILEEHGYTSGGEYQVRDGRLEVQTGPKGFTFGFGGLPANLERASVRPGVFWGANKKDSLRLQIIMEGQSVDESEWVLSSSNHKGFRTLEAFTIKGKGKQTFEKDVSMVRQIIAPFSFHTGLRLERQTPGAQLSIDSIKFAPSSADIYYRKTFELADKSVRAHASMNYYDTFQLYVNGQLVDEGTRVAPAGPMRTVDLTPYLKAGANTIAYWKQFYAWHGAGAQAFLFEGAAISRDGTVTHLLGDDSWKVTYHAPDGWMKPEFEDSTWKNAAATKKSNRRVGLPYMTKLLDGTEVPNGLDPKHMGALDLVPNGRQYPIYDHTEGGSFRLSLPAGVQEKLASGALKVSTQVFKAGADVPIQTLEVTGFQVEGDFTSAIAKVETREVGPYRLVTTLVDDAGKILETRRDELLIVGPIPQDKVALGEFEADLEKRLNLVQHIDCTVEPEADQFLDHAGMYQKPAVNKGKVATVNGLTYRETGPDRYDHFNYRLQGIKRGQPYIVEVVVPDDRERAIYSGIIDQMPINYFNNSPGTGFFAVSGSVRTGGRYPLTGGFRKLRYVYYARSEVAAVSVISSLSGVPAAASEINIYEVKGGLPALAVPESARLFGPHEERMSVNAWSFSAENPLVNAPNLTVNGQRDGWAHWYRIFERKISYLRFQGFNSVVEGVWMYEEPFFPRKRGELITGEEIDLPYLAIQMYKHNGIKPYLGVEYVVDPAVGVDLVDTASDRRMWLGEPTPQLVDRYGRQVGRSIWGNGNFLHPTTKKYLHGMIGDLYERYHSAGPVEGLFMVSSGWWIPGFRQGAYPVRMDEVGYGDFTVSLFEKETGISLGIDPLDPQRFQKRYSALMGDHRAKWLEWRALKTHGAFADISKLIRGKDKDWNLLLDSGGMPLDLSTQHARSENPMRVGMADRDIVPELFEKSPDIIMTPGLAATSWQASRPGEKVALHHALLTKPESGKMVQRMGGMRIGGPLDEVDNPSKAADRWIWNSTSRGVFVPRGIEDNALNDFVNLMTHGIPQLVLYSWIDMNVESAFGPQLRRFAKSFYVTPEVEFSELPAAQVQGIIAQAGKGPEGNYLRLVNNSPYPAEGTITGTASGIRDLVYDVDLAAAGGGSGFAVQLAPNDIRILSVAGGDAAALTCAFNFPAEPLARVTKQAQELLANPDLRDAVPTAQATELQAAITSGNGFAMYRVLDHWEVVNVVSNPKQFIEGKRNQTRLLSLLEQEGVARINCGATDSYRDEDRKLWLPDQQAVGLKVYGYTDAESARRGNIKVTGTPAPKVFLTELYGGNLAYQLPLPDGKYTVTLHFAETFEPNSRPGSRIFTVEIAGTPEEQIDLVARAGGQFRPLEVSKTVQVTGGLVKIAFTGEALLNGVTIQKVP